MSEQHKPCGWTYWIVAGLIVAVLYVASIGPAYWLSNHTSRGVGAFWTVYRPVVWLAGKSKAGAKVYYAYLDFWEPWPEMGYPVLIIDP